MKKSDYYVYKSSFGAQPHKNFFVAVFGDSCVPLHLFIQCETECNKWQLSIRGTKDGSTLSKYVIGD